MTITTSTLRQSVYETIYDALTAANLLSSTVTVTAAYIDDDQSFPQVVVHPISINKSAFSFDRTSNLDECTVMIDVWTKKNKQKDQISDEIDQLSSIKRINGLMLTDWNENNALESIQGNKLHLKTITMTYARRG